MSKTVQFKLRGEEWRFVQAIVNAVGEPGGLQYFAKAATIEAARRIFQLSREEADGEILSGEESTDSPRDISNNSAPSCGGDAFPDEEAISDGRPRADGGDDSVGASHERGAVSEDSGVLDE